MRPKTKKYSRQQIEESIKFWTRILENKSAFLDLLVSDFGYDAVFGKQKFFVTSIDDIECIASAANKVIFHDELLNVRFKLDVKHQFTSEDIPFGYAYCTYEDSQNGKCTLLQQDARDESGNEYLAPTVFVLPSLVKSAKFTLISLASIIVHELLHKKIIESSNSEELARIARESQHDNGHNAQFLQLMKKINSEHGLNITAAGSMAYDGDSMQALKNFAGDDYKLREGEKEVPLSRVEKLKNGMTRVVLH